eukprot:3385039-Amphidinium_carterae.2
MQQIVGFGNTSRTTSTFVMKSSNSPPEKRPSSSSTFRLNRLKRDFQARITSAHWNAVFTHEYFLQSKLVTKLPPAHCTSNNCPGCPRVTLHQAINRSTEFVHSYCIVAGLHMQVALLQYPTLHTLPPHGAKLSTRT